MNDTQYIRDRTDEILRAKIALGMTGGEGEGMRRRRRSGSKSCKLNDNYKKCPKGSRKKDGRCVMNKRMPNKRNCPRGSRKAGAMDMNPYYESNFGSAHHPEMSAGPLFENDLVSVYPSRRHHEAVGGRKRKNPRRKRHSPWIEFVKDYAAMHDIPYSQALQEASHEWRRMKRC